MNNEQRAYISSIKDSAQEEIFIKKTGWEEISLSGHSHNKHQIIYTLSGTLHVQIGSTSYFVPEKHIGWIPKNVEHELCSKNRQVSLVIYYVDWAEEAHRAFMHGVFHLCHQCHDSRKPEVHSLQRHED